MLMCFYITFELLLKQTFWLNYWLRGLIQGNGNVDKTNLLFYEINLCELGRFLKWTFRELYWVTIDATDNLLISSYITVF